MFILGEHVRIECTAPAIYKLLVANFGAMAAVGDDAAPSLHYTITVAGPPPSYEIVQSGQPTLHESSLGDLLFRLEKEITVRLQKGRPDLFFLHSAAIEWGGKAFLLAANAGSGKSTTTWALLHHGFRYLSDELSPIDLETMEVLAYPHALCLKRPPPAYPLPSEAIHLGRTIHVPVPSMPCAAASGPIPLGSVFLLRESPDFASPSVRAIGPAEASARLYLTALNALAHPNSGLDAVVGIAERVPCFDIATSDLPETCALIHSAIERINDSATK